MYKITTEDSITTQYQNIVDATNIVSKSDIYGNITYVNRKFIDISGYTEKELIGKPHNILRDPDLDTAIFKNLWLTIQSKNIWSGVITNIKKNGTKYTVQASIFPILDAAGEVQEYISIRHDISHMIELNKQISQLHHYRLEQEELAKEKFESGIVNDMTQNECKILYHPSDTLSGDFYSLYKRDDGSIFIYLMDGQGHGISPALTVFAISSMINQNIHKLNNFSEIIEQIAPNVKNFLGDVEQLSYTMIMINPDKETLSYASAGMYPFLIKQGDEITKIKANNTPFMNFSPTPSIETLKVKNWDSLMIYSDGIVEHENKELLDCTPEILMQEPKKITTALEKIKFYKFDDDVTLIHLKNSDNP